MEQLISDLVKNLEQEKKTTKESLSAIDNPSQHAELDKK